MAMQTKEARVAPSLMLLLAAITSQAFCIFANHHSITMHHLESEETVAPLDDGASPRCPAVFASTVVEQRLQHILRHCGGEQAAFLRRQSLANRFMDTMLTQLRSLSPLFARAVLLRLGSAYEGTRVSQAVDFDGFVALNESLLRPFELERDMDGHVATRLRPGVTRESLPAELLQLLTADGYMDARSFKRWALTRLEAAIRLAAAEHPELRVSGWTRRQVAEAELVSEEGRVNIDFSMMVAAPEEWRGLRPAALRPCDINLVTGGRSPRWHFYSRQYLDKPPATEQSARWFIVQANQLEQNLLHLVPRLREVTRVLKAVSAARHWEVRFRIHPTALKHAAMWTYAAGCDRQEWQAGSDLVPAVVTSLRTVQQALRRGRLDCFWVDGPTNKLRYELADDDARAQELINNITEVVKVLASGDLQGVQRLFQSACQYRPFWNRRVAYE